MSTLYQDNAALAASTDRGQVADMVLRLAAFQAIDLFRSGRAPTSMPRATSPTTSGSS